MRALLKSTYLSLTILIIIACISCNKTEESNQQNDQFDRTEMLINWSDNLIIPSFESYVASLAELTISKDEFIETPTITNYEKLTSKWLAAYLSWQNVSMFDIGKAEEISLRNFTNIFPTDTEAIKNNISSLNYNLELPSNFDTQGFPALDYILFGLSENKEELINLLAEPNTLVYIDDLVNRLYLLANSVLEDWKGDYREEFISNAGSSATASVDKMVNDFLYYYEKYFRAGKIGIPAGIFSGNPIALTVEAPYSSIYSKSLFLAALEAVNNFFVGINPNNLNNGISLSDYLNYTKDNFGLEDLSQKIITHWNEVSVQANKLEDSFKNQVEEDNLLMLQTYDALQKVVPILKVDMLQALNIQVDYIDADGD